jgi:hypothetical protein
MKTPDLAIKKLFFAVYSLKKSTEVITIKRKKMKD